jgi:hypothetical protein
VTKPNHKQPILPGAVFRPPNWAPLFTDAFFRARDCVGSRTVAAHDLYQDLLAGHLPSAIREFDRNEVEIRAEILKPDFWQQFVLKESAWLPTDGKPDPGMRLWLRDADLYPFWSAMFYAQRAKLDLLYPNPATPQGNEGESPISAPSPPFRRRKGKHLWSEISGEIAHRCIDPPTRRVNVPENELKLADDVLQWCENKWKRQPPLSDMRELVAAICAALRKI